MALTILHLSDFHFKTEEAYNAELVKTALLSHIERRVAAGNGPAGIFVTGDIANSGQRAELDRASEFFDKLLECSALEKSKLFVVPGNHDVNRRRLGGLARTLDSQYNADEILGGRHEIPQVSLGQSDFVQWYNSYFKGIDAFDTSSTCGRPRTIHDGGMRLVVVGANSAVFSQDDHDHGKLWLGRRCIANACAAATEISSDCRVLLMHHPIEWMHEAEQSTVRALIMDGFDIVCSGHLHETDYSEVSGPSGHCLRIVAGASYQTAPWPKRAHWLSFERGEVKIEPIRFEETPMPVWTIDPSVFPLENGCTRTLQLPVRHKALVVRGGTSPVPLHQAVSLNVNEIEDADLFRAPDGAQIYVEPRIAKIPQVAAAEDQTDLETLSVAEIASQSSNTVIHCPFEHGATQLARRLADALTGAGAEVRLESAGSLPTYDRKIADYFSDVASGNSSRVVILDNFVPSRDGRLLKELRKARVFTRFIALARSSPISAAAEIMPELEEDSFQEYHLWGLDRQRIRTVAERIFSSSSIEHVSAAVEKTYSDLLGLTIPLTPANVIMYLHILWKESDFQPLDRVNIIERYTREVLSVPSDAFAGAFNVKNKMALAAAFVKRIFDQGATTFQLSDWTNFCREYSERTLVSFDATSVFEVFESARIFVRIGRTYHLRYSFLYSYFVALSVANRPAELEEFVSRELYYALPSIVEAVSAASTDNTFLLNDLTGKLRGYIAEFYDEYLSGKFDPLINAHWPDADNEQEALWEPINRDIAEGPAEPEKIDELRSSLVSEARSLNQQVILRRFTEMEEKLFSTITVLEEALKNSDDVAGTLKIDTLNTLLEAYLIVLEIGALLSGVLATRRVFRWGGLVFFNNNPELDTQEELIEGLSPWVIPSLNNTLAKNAMERLASKKLGSLFIAYAERSDLSEFEAMMTLCLVLQAKPAGWSGTLEKIIKTIDRRQYRLYLILRFLRSDFKRGLNTHSDREELKRLMALIETKRRTKTNSPGNRAVGKMLHLLEQRKFFEVMAKRGVSDMNGDQLLRVDREEDISAIRDGA